MLFVLDPLIPKG